MIFYSLNIFIYIISFFILYLFYINWSVVINIEFCNLFGIDKFHVSVGFTHCGLYERK